MGYLIAIEHDPKCHKEIKESLTPLAKEIGHELLMFENVAAFKEEFAKPEYAEKAVLLIVISLEQAGQDHTATINALKEEFKTDVLLSMFEDPLKPYKNPELLPVHNIVYKPFDLTILKEHTRFALKPGQKISTMFVHTTQIATRIEMIKKFRILDFSEFGMKVDKAHALNVGKLSKFYHPLFAHKKTQHIWARVVHETPEHYELLFCQTVPGILSQIRKKVAATTHKVKNAVWSGITEHKHNALKIALQLDDTQAAAIQDLLSRNYKNLSFVPAKDINPKEKMNVDVLITEQEYDVKTLKNQFQPAPLVIRLHDDKEALTREELEKQFEVEFLRIEKPLDRAALVKSFRLCFPQLAENDEPVQLITINLDEICSLSENLHVSEFSEAAMTFSDPVRYELNQIIEIALPQEDESQLQEMKAKIHFSADKPNPKKEFDQQFVLFGMKDEYLKLIRLWALQKHIEKNKKGA